MSLRYFMSRIVDQGIMRAVLGIRDQASKSIKDTSAAASSASKRVRRFTSALDSKGAVTGSEDKGKRAEESLRAGMYLSCWGPN